MAERYCVALTTAALADLDEIGDHMAQARGLDAAKDLVAKLRAHVAQLDQFALRGPVPKELATTGKADIRQTMLGIYRIFYKVTDRDVAVIMFADGRRDMPALLAARLFGR